jgi:hypothetical protein
MKLLICIAAICVRQKKQSAPKALQATMDFWCYKATIDFNLFLACITVYFQYFLLN